MSFQPLQDRVLVDPISVDNVTDAGIVLQYTETNKTPIVGVVVAVGPGRWSGEVFVTPNVKSGDKVTWGKFMGSHLLVDGKELLVMRESDIVGILT